MIYIPSNDAAARKEWRCEKCTNGLTWVSENLLEKIKFCPFCGAAAKEKSNLCLPYPLSAFKPYLTFFKAAEQRFYLEKKNTDGQVTTGFYIIRNFTDNAVTFYNNNEVQICLFKYYNINWRVWSVYPPDDLRQRCPWNESNPLNSVITAPPLTKKEYS